MTTTAALARYQMYIGGQWVEASSHEHFESDDPFHAAPWALIPRGSADDVVDTVEAASANRSSGSGSCGALWTAEFNLAMALSRSVYTLTRAAPAMTR